MRRLARWTGFFLVATAMALLGAWCALALWFRLPASGPLRGLAALACLSGALVAAGFLATSQRALAFASYAGGVALILVWWATIRPSNDRNWTPDSARVATASIDGDRLVIDNVRDFDWRGESDFDPVWQQRSYSLAAVTDVDLIMSHWDGEAIAHTMVSFGFGDAPRLVFSVETRKEAGEPYSPLAGFFKEYELAVVAADERDVVRVRSNVRGEDVRIYRLRIAPEDARNLLRAYAAVANDVAKRPRFYNTLTANCTTLVFGMVRVLHPGLRLDPRILISGYLPNYVHDLGATDTSMAFARLRDLSHIRDKARRADADPAFSARIRDGIPVPR